MAKITTRQHVLDFLDKEGSEGRRLADRYRAKNGLRVQDRCYLCDTEGHYYTCPESDRVAFSCSNYTKVDERKRKRAESKRFNEQRKREHGYA